MRDSLKNLSESDYWVYGIRKEEFDHALQLVRDLIQARVEQYQKEAGKVREEHPDTADDILDDVAYYNYTDNQYLWHFALWRLQGLLEAVIVHQLVENIERKLFGLKTKIEALEKNGFTISSSEKEELMLWANLRNAFSHAPPEQYRPTGLNEDDIVEYQSLAKNLYQRWMKEKENK